MENWRNGFFVPHWNCNRVSYCGSTRRHIRQETDIQAWLMHASSIHRNNLLLKDEQHLHTVRPACLFWNELDSTLLCWILIQHWDVAKVSPAIGQHDPVLVRVICLLLRLHILYVPNKKLVLPANSEPLPDGARTYLPLHDAWNPKILAQLAQILISAGCFW